MMQKKSSASTKHFTEFRSLRVRALWLALSMLSGNLPAQEGNYRFENFGNQSVLLNGSVTGSVSDLGLVYYNPARLALIENPAFTIGGKAYEWSRYYFEDLVRDESNVGSNNFGKIPGTIAGTFSSKSLPKHKFAYSILSRHQSEVSVASNTGIVPGNYIPAIGLSSSGLQDLSFRDVLQEEWFGITWAHAPSENFGLGISLFGSIYNINGTGTIMVTAENEEGGYVSYMNQITYRQKTYGLFLIAGAAWRLGATELGLRLNLPFLAVIQKASLRYEESLAGLSPAEDFLIYEDFRDLENRRRTAPGLALGAGIPWNRHKLHLNLEWFGPLGPYERISFPAGTGQDPTRVNPFVEKLRSVVNFGAGAEIYLSQTVNLLGSVSTDFSAMEAGINLFDSFNRGESELNLLNDIWHAALGVNLKFNWGHIFLGSSYARTSGSFGNEPESPGEGAGGSPANLTSKIGFERWRFITGLEIPLLRDKLKNLPIPVN